MSELPEVIVGIDPGMSKTGVAVVAKEGDNYILLDSHLILSAPWDKSAESSYTGVYEVVYGIVSELLDRFGWVDTWAIELQPYSSQCVFKGGVVVQNAVGYAAVAEGKQIELLNVSHIKRVIGGHGKADKEMVADGASSILGVDSWETDDVSDAAAVALCAHMDLESKEAGVYLQRMQENFKSYQKQYREDNQLKLRQQKKDYYESVMSDPIRADAERKRSRERARELRKDPVYRESQNRKARERNADNRDEYNRKNREYYHLYMSDPEYKNRLRERERENRKKRMSDSEYRESFNAKRREYIRKRSQDPEYRARINEQARLRRLKKKQAMECVNVS